MQLELPESIDPAMMAMSCDEIDAALDELSYLASFHAGEAEFYQSEVYAYETDPWFVGGQVLQQWGQNVLMLAAPGAVHMKIATWLRLQRVLVGGGRIYTGGGFSRVAIGETRWGNIPGSAAGGLAGLAWGGCAAVYADYLSGVLGIPITDDQISDASWQAMAEALAQGYALSKEMAAYHEAQQQDAIDRYYKLLDVRAILRCDTQCDQSGDAKE